MCLRQVEQEYRSRSEPMILIDMCVPVASLRQTGLFVNHIYGISQKRSLLPDILAILALSGCDSVAALHRVGKGIAIKTALSLLEQGYNATIWAE